MIEKVNKTSIIISFIALVISILTFSYFHYDINLKNRPYLYVETKLPITWEYVDPKTNTPGHRKVKIGIKMGNRGVIPASLKKIDWYVAHDTAEIKNPSVFYKEKFKKDLFYRTVFPEQIIELPDYNPDVPPDMQTLDLNAVVSYEGTTRSFLSIFGRYKTYWYLLKSRYKFRYNSDGTVSITQAYYETDWDRNIGDELPSPLTDAK